MSDSDPPIPLGRRPFGALVALSAVDADAAMALASAYAQLDAAGRRAFVAAVEWDASAEGVDAGAPLAALLAVERDTELARAIQDAMLDGRPLETSTEAHAACAGDSRMGAALLVSPLYGPFVEVLAAVWDENGFGQTWVEPLLHHAHVDRVRARLPDGVPLVQCAFSEGRERLAEACWRALRADKMVPSLLAAHV